MTAAWFAHLLLGGEKNPAPDDHRFKRECELALLCARTGATPDGRPIGEQGERFMALVSAAQQWLCAMERTRVL